jgi:hypothetical protein
VSAGDHRRPAEAGRRLDGGENADFRVDGVPRLEMVQEFGAQDHIDRILDLGHVDGGETRTNHCHQVFDHEAAGPPVQAHADPRPAGRRGSLQALQKLDHGLASHRFLVVRHRVLEVDGDGVGAAAERRVEAFGSVAGNE